MEVRKCKFILINSLQNMPYNLENCQVKFCTYIIILSLRWYKRMVETETVQYKPFQNKASWSIILTLNHNKCLTLILNTKTKATWQSITHVEPLSKVMLCIFPLLFFTLYICIYHWWIEYISYKTKNKKTKILY